MKDISIWENTVVPYKVKKEKLPEKVDILIIGSGITGITSAFYLKDTPYNICVIDRGTIGLGCTAKTTGKLTYLQGTCYQKIASMYDKETSKKYLDSQKEAISLVKNNVATHKIDCDLKKEDSYIFIKNENEMAALEKEKDLLKEWNIPFEEEKNLPISYPIYSSIKVRDTYTFHPLKYIYKLAEMCEEAGITFCENITAHSIEKNKKDYLIHTDKGNIRAGKVVVATHYPFFIKPSFIPLKSHIERSYLLASPIEEPKDFQAVYTEKPYDTMRYYKENFIYGGLGHKTSTQTNYEENYEDLLEKYNRNFKGDPSHIWCAHDVMSEDHMPYIGLVDKEEDNIFMATGFNKWGMTNGTIAGKMIADFITEKKNPYKDLFSPYRSYNINRIGAFLINGFSTGKIYLQTKLIRNPYFYDSSVRVYKKDGIYYGEYKDKEGIHTVHQKCPHMGCSLLFNQHDKTWDCPCHGSRFDKDGNVLSGPSTYSIKLEDNK